MESVKCEIIENCEPVPGVCVAVGTVEVKERVRNEVPYNDESINT